MLLPRLSIRRAFALLLAALLGLTATGRAQIINYNDGDNVTNTFDAANLTFLNIISGSATENGELKGIGVIKNGAGTLTLGDTDEGLIGSYFSDGSNFSVTGGTVIFSGNFKNSSISVGSGGGFTIEGGATADFQSGFESNGSNGSGASNDTDGGDGGDFTMSDDSTATFGSIFDNSGGAADAASYGSYGGDGGDFTMSSGSSATFTGTFRSIGGANGGGAGGNFTMSDGSTATFGNIFDNSGGDATGSGGNGGDFTMSSGSSATFTGTFSSKGGNGGGDGGNFTMSDGSTATFGNIFDNSGGAGNIAGNDGNGGNGGDFTMSNGSSATFTGTFSSKGGYSDYGYGGDGGDFTMSSGSSATFTGTFSSKGDNSDYGDGGDGGNFTMSDGSTATFGSIFDNSGGDGIKAGNGGNGGDFTISGNSQATFGSTSSMNLRGGYGITPGADGTLTLNSGTLEIPTLGWMADDATFQGNFAFQAGTLKTTAATPGPAVTAGATDPLGQGFNTAATGPRTLDTNGTLTLDSTVNLNGSGSFTKAGSGTLTLAGNATHTGGTTVSGGTLRIGAGGSTGSITGDITNHATLVFDRAEGETIAYAGAISGTGTTTVASGTLNLAGASLTGNTLQVGEGGATGAIAGDFANSTALVFNRGAGDALAYGGVVSGTGTLAKQGAGTVILSGDHTYTGNTTITAGTLQIGHGGASGSIAHSAITNNATLVFDRAGTFTHTGTITNTGTVAVAGGTLDLAGASINGGTLQIGNGGETGAITGDTSSVNVANLAFNRSNALAFAQNHSGTGTVIQRGTGTTTVTGNLTHTGGTTVEHGTLQIGDGSAGSISGDIAVESGATLAFNRDDATTYTDAITGDGTFTKQGAGTLTLTGTLGAGTTTLTAGTLQIGDGGETGSISGDITNNAALVFNRSDTTGYTGVLSGTGTLTKQGAGGLGLSGENTFTGATTVESGELTILGSHTGDIALTSGTTLTFWRDTDSTYAGDLSGNGQIYKQGAGTLTLTGINTVGYTAGSDGNFYVNQGQITVSGADASLTAPYLSVGRDRGLWTGQTGTLAIENGGTVNSTLGVVGFDAGTTGRLTITGADSRLNNTGFFTIGLDGTGAVTLADGGSATVAGALNVAFASGSTGTINIGAAAGDAATAAGYLDAATVTGGSGTATLQFNTDDDATTYFTRDGTASGAGVDTAGALQLVHTAGTTVATGALAHTGGTTINGGTLQIGDGGADGSISGDITNAGELVFNRAHADTIAYAGTITNSGTVTVASGTLDLSGGATITGGSLQIGQGGTTGSITGSFSSGSSLIFNRSDALSFAQDLGGNGSLTQRGTGTTTLTGANTYTGATTIEAGTLVIGGSISDDSNITNSGTLVFDRDDAYTYGGDISGTGALTKIGDGTVTLSGAHTYTGATTIEVGTLALNHATDAILNGDVTGAGTLVKQGAGRTVLNNLTVGSTQIEAGTLAVGGTLSGDIALTSGSKLILGGSGVTYADSISGAGELYRIWSGFGNENFTLTGENTLTTGTGADGNTHIVSGRLTVSGAAASLTTPYLSIGRDYGELSITGRTGTLAIENGGTVTSTIGALGYDAGSTGRMIVTGAGSTWNNTGFANIGNNGTGTLTLSNGGSATIDGALTVAFASGSTGTINIGSPAGGSPGNAGYLDTASVTGGSGTATLQFNTTGSAAAPTYFTRDGTSVGTGVGTAGALQLVHTAGTTVATGALAHTGGTTINGGTLQIGNGGATGSITGDITNAGELVFNRADGDTIAYADTITNSGGTVTVASGTLDLAAATITGGSLQVGTGGTTGNVSGNFSSGTNLIFNRSDSVTVSQNLSGTGSLTQRGTGTLYVTGENTHTGGTTIERGMVEIGTGGTTGSITGDIVNHAGLVFNRSDTVVLTDDITGTGTTIIIGGLQVGDGGTTGSITNDITNAGTLTFNRSDNLAYAGDVSGSGNLAKQGMGALTLTGDVETGGTTVAQGALFVGDGGTSGSLSGSATLGAGTVLSFNRADASSYAQNISGQGALFKEGAGTLTLTGDTNLAPGGGPGGPFDGGAFLTAGTVKVSGGELNAIFLNVGTAASGTATLSLENGATATSTFAELGAKAGPPDANLPTGIVTVTGPGSTWTNSDTVTIGGTGHGVLNLRNGGTATLAGPVTLGGAPGTTGTINFGGAAGSTATATGILDTASITTGMGAGTLQFNTTGTTAAPTYFTRDGTELGDAIALSGAIDLVHTAGTTVFTGDLAHTGATTITGGTAMFLGTVSQSLVTVQSGGAIDGSGYFGAGLTLESGAILSWATPFAPSLVLTGGALTLNSGIILNIAPDLPFFSAGTFDLIDASSATSISSYDSSLFSVGTSPSGYDFSFAWSGNILQLTSALSAVPEPSTYAAILGVLALGAVFWRRRARAK